MYAKHILAGALTFGLAGAVLGWAWVVSDVPFFMALQWAAGAGVLGALAGGWRLALSEAVISGLVYLVAFTVFIFIALAVWEGPLPVAFASAVAGLAAGGLLAGKEGAWRVGLAAFLGFALGELAVAGLSALQPEAASEPGAVQYAWFAAAQGVAGLIGGAAVGAVFAYVVLHGRATREAKTP